MTAPAPTLDELDALVGCELEHRWVERPWGRQHVVVAGPPDAERTVLLVHGWPQHWFAWRRVIEAQVASGARVIAPDLRGFGWSEPRRSSARGVTVRSMAADLIAVLDAIGGPTVAMASHDWGGWIAFRAALDHPERFTAHAAISIMAPWLDRRSMREGLAGWSYIFPMAVAGRRIARRSEHVRVMLDLSTTAPIWDEGEGAIALASYLERIGQGAAPATTRRLYAQFLVRELPRAVRRRRDPRLAMATTIVLGEDESISLPAHWQSRALPGEIDLVEVPGARHWLAEEAPAATIAALEDALRPH